MKARFVDTNIFLRYLTKDDAEGYEYARNVFEKAVEGTARLFTSELVIAELVWTLTSYYKIEKEEVVEKAYIILNTPNLEVASRKILEEALLLYLNKNVDFIDAYNAVCMKHRGTEEIHTFDRDFDRLDFVKRI